MANVNGSWRTAVDSSLGVEKGTLTIVSSGTSFSGTWTGTAGTQEIKNGKIDGDTLTWKVDISVPTPMTMECKATVSGDNMSGTVSPGAFGSFPLTGTRA